MSAKTNDAIRAREQAKIRPVPIALPKKPKKVKPDPVVEIAPDYAESAE